MELYLSQILLLSSELYGIELYLFQSYSILISSVIDYATIALRGILQAAESIAVC